jgi:hypothetical protein
MGGCDECMENRLSGLYSERRKLATGAKNILGTAKSGIRMIGQANTFANKIGVSSPQMNNMSNNLQQMSDLIDV